MAGLPVYVPVVSTCDTLRRKQVSTPLSSGLPPLPLHSEANTGRWLLTGLQAHLPMLSQEVGQLRLQPLSIAGPACPEAPQSTGSANRKGALPLPALSVLEAGRGPGSLRHTGGRHMPPGYGTRTQGLGLPTPGSCSPREQHRPSYQTRPLHTPEALFQPLQEGV